MLLLAAAAWIFRDYRWVYGVVWLLMLPVYLLLDLLIPQPVHQGLLMALMCLGYLAAGYALGRRRRRLAWPFLSAATLLSAVVPVLTWESPWVASLILAALTALYALTALWLDWPWLLMPGLLAGNLAVLALNRVFFEPRTVLEVALIVSYTLLGIALVFGGLSLRRSGRPRWAWPLYLAGVLDLAVGYGASLGAGRWTSVALSTVTAGLLLAFAWLERDPLRAARCRPLLTFLSVGAILAGLFFLLDAVSGRSALRVWPAYAAGLCALFIALAWLLHGRSEPVVQIYTRPLTYSGRLLIAIPLLGAVALNSPILGAVTFGISAIMYAADAVLRRERHLGYLAVGGLVVTIWYVFQALYVDESQAYVAPLGLALAGIGWNERRYGRLLWYRLSTLAGLLTLMGAAFVQSLPRQAWAYAALLLVESLLAVAWGVRNRARGYCQVGALALLANAVAQLGPGFLELTRWIQIGVSGAILLGAGLAALFKREEILATRHRLTEQWRQWGP